MSFAIRSLCNHHAAEVSGCKLEELSPHVCYIRLRQRIGEQIQKQLEEKLLQDEVKDRDKLQIREMHERMHPEYLKVQTQEGGAAHPQTPTFIACSDMQHVQYTYMGWKSVCFSDRLLPGQGGGGGRSWVILAASWMRPYDNRWRSKSAKICEEADRLMRKLSRTYF